MQGVRSCSSPDCRHVALRAWQSRTDNKQHMFGRASKASTFLVATQWDIWAAQPVYRIVAIDAFLTGKAIPWLLVCCALRSQIFGKPDKPLAQLSRYRSHELDDASLLSREISRIARYRL